MDNGQKKLDIDSLRIELFFKFVEIALQKNEFLSLEDIIQIYQLFENEYTHSFNLDDDGPV